MSWSIKSNAITLTRGDSFKAQLSLKDSSGAKYKPQDGDSIRFALKKFFKDSYPVLLEKEISTESMVLSLDPEDTNTLDFGTYYYDIQLTKSDGTVDTVVTMSKFILSEEAEVKQ